METEEKKRIQSGNVHHGHTIKRLRRARGITQKQLAQLMHVSQQQISLYEEKDEIEERILKQFSEVLEVPVDLIKNMEEETKLSFYIENNTITNENKDNSNANGSSVNGNIGEIGNINTTNQTDKALYTALEQMQKLYEKGMQLYESSLQSNNQLLKTLQERIDILEKQQNK